MFRSIAIVYVLVQCRAFSLAPTKRVANKINFSSSKSLDLVKDNNIASRCSKLKAVSSESKSTSQPIKLNTLELLTSLIVFPTVFSFVIPFLINEITDYNISTSLRQFFIIFLLLFKRFYLYSMSLVILDTSSKLANQNYIPNLGERLLNINQELLPASMLSMSYVDVDTNIVDENKSISTKKAVISQETKEMYASIDNIDETKLALVLPIFLSISLAGSFYVLTHATSTGGDTALFDETVNYILNSDAVVALKGIFIKWLPLLANFGVSFLFVKSLLSNSNSQSEDVSNESSSDAEDKYDTSTASVLAVLLTIASFLVPPGGGSASDLLTQLAWPLHNFINACLCITVSRVLQVNSLLTVALALLGLTVYDVLAVAGTQMYSDNGNSVMEAIATAKLGLSSQVISSEAVRASTTASSTVSNILSTSPLAGASVSVTDNIDSITLYIKNSFLNGFESASHFDKILDVFKWRPGLLEVAVQGRVSDALGLGDIVFPAILSSWVLRYETSRNNQNASNSKNEDLSGDGIYSNNKVSKKNKTDNNNSSNSNSNDKGNDYTLYKSTLGGYAIGCILSDVFMALGLSGTSGGQPALLFLVPCMLVTLGAVSGARKEWNSMVNYISN